MRPRKNDEARPNESESDLNREVCSAKTDADPTELPRFTARPLRKVAPRLIESIKDLK